MSFTEFCIQRRLFIEAGAQASCLRFARILRAEKKRRATPASKRFALCPLLFAHLVLLDDIPMNYHIGLCAIASIKRDIVF